MENSFFEEFKPGMVVISRAGRDKGRLLAVIETQDGAVIVADGKERPLGRPKRKNPKHLMKTKMTLDIGNITDKSLRRGLRALANGAKGCAEDEET